MYINGSVDLFSVDAIVRTVLFQSITLDIWVL